MAVRFCHGAPNNGGIMSQKDTIDRAYGSIPKEVGYSIEWNFIPTWRGIKYYWYKYTRKVTR